MWIGCAIRRSDRDQAGTGQREFLPRRGFRGSLVWTSAAPHVAAGLLFAGNPTGSTTLANPIDLVPRTLDISLI